VTDPLLQEQIAYYRARAPEYDEWFLRRGRYDLGAEQNARWRAELDEVVRALSAFGPRGRVVELAGGTGFWTELLARTADELTVVDASPESLRINRGRVGDARVRYVEADLFAWQPDRAYDAVVFAFWLSHVPPARFDGFWDLVARCLSPGGRAFFVDNLNPSSTAHDHRLLQPGEVTVTRELNDGRQFQIYKLFYRPDDLARRLEERGWRADVRTTTEYFLFGLAEKAS
jgi:demethylmenaquinone methyltransferase/2-methoxy-6-polyprenyl-1,4-benzoquinol methylase